MAKTRAPKPKSKSKSKSSKREKSILNSTRAFSTNPHATSTTTAVSITKPDNGQHLLAEATTLLHENSSPSAALPLLKKYLETNPNSPQALDLLGEAQIELGDTDAAFAAFSRSAEVDPQGLSAPEGTGPEKFLWLAQLSSAETAVGYYERGVGIIKRWLSTPPAPSLAPAEPERDRGLPKKLVTTLCALAEIYMTDLCMSPDAEARCERYVTEALLTLPDSAVALQTLASMRISQQRPEDAIAALKRAFQGWRELPLAHEDVPAYADRVNLSKLLIETGEYEVALEVLERLKEEDDQLPDLWYLGGWCLFLMGEGERGKKEEGEWEESWEAAREWLANCILLYNALEWEDEGIRDHAMEILSNIEKELPEGMDDGNDEDEEDAEEGEWESEADDGDDKMKD
ncbi:TPR-like protein [Choiromyces venosus 120613-1]|uniref:TPR-like protein n=1 Tax=Choiromyces venosus 120613-1 TaxID=1336337 RepID=A0A3N4JM61_9PEZI|nr:TPR-like protein [Choiromyces venosus 120613-1]